MLSDLKRSQTGQFRFQALFSPTWMEKYHGNFSSGSSILTRIRPGVFQAQYGAHGLELVHYRDGQGVKITGDPNVPFNAITFRVTSRDRVDFPPEIQSDIGRLQAATEDFGQFCVDDSQVRVKRQRERELMFSFEELKFPLQLPDYMYLRGDLPRSRSQYLGTWTAEGHIAEHGFTNDSFIPANFVLINEDKFGVAFLEFHDMMVFSRIEM